MQTKQQFPPGTRVYRLDFLTGGLPMPGTVVAGDCGENEVMVETEHSVSAVHIDKLQAAVGNHDLVVLCLSQAQYDTLDGKLRMRLQERAVSVTTFKPGNKAKVSKSRMTEQPKTEVSHADALKLLQDTVHNYTSNS